MSIIIIRKSGLLTADDCMKLFGDPVKNESNHMMLLRPWSLIEAIPKRIYCNKNLEVALTTALSNIEKRGLCDEVKTWDGCFNIRKSKGGRSLSIHSWGLAIDINAAWNGYGKQPTMLPELVKCFKDAGFDWGGDWRKPDGMHFQLKRSILL